jgi:phospholipid-binding lipoprotein MlaA
MLLLVLAMADTVSGTAKPQVQAAPIVASAPPVAQVNPAPAPPTPPATIDPSIPPTDTTAALPTDAATPTPTDSIPAASTETPSTTALSEVVAQPRDPWVKLNRKIFSFDIALERHLLAPVSHGYVHVVPHVVRYHVTSALFNLGEPLTAVNDLLQLRIGSMGKAVFRFVVNSTVGVAGLFDVAKSSGVPIHISDFGQTLGRYGFKPGNYVMIPLLGPSNIRDGFGRIVDNFIDPVELLIGGITSPEGASLFVLEGVDWRSRADDTLKAVYGATDPYAFTRSAYTQSRAATVSEATGKQAALPDFDAAPGTP